MTRRGPFRSASIGVTFVVLWVSIGGDRAQGRDFRWGGSLRGYQFLRLEDTPGQRRDAELANLRITSELGWGAHLRLESHGTLTFLSPPLLGAVSLADARSPVFLSLQGTIAEGDGAALLAGFDRLSLRAEMGRVRLVVGRQPMTWGVNHFWPALDLFAPFAPQRIDRDYKPGVDAIRVTVPLGSFSEVEVAGGILGSSRAGDGALAALTRVHLGRVDVGFMGGTFHRDRVAGGFFTADVRGTGLRGEITWTDSGDPLDEFRDREGFWRGSLGVDRLLNPFLTLTLEGAWNGYGVSDPEDYLKMLGSDRILRGEITALGRIHVGSSLGWQLHPLWMFNNTVLINVRDPSGLWIPTARWSTGNNTELLFGAQFGFGDDLRPGGVPGSEYGAAPHTLLVSFKGYF
jgi:hypothetical protein